MDEIVLIDNKLARLLLNSASIKKIPYFKKLTRHLKIEGILTAKQSKKLKISSYTLEALIKECQSEWEYSAKDYRYVPGDHTGFECQLCDQKNLNHLHYVKNKETKVKWLIGSSCAEEFGDYKLNVPSDQEIQHKKTAVIQQLSDVVPDLLSYLESNKQFHKKYATLPKELFKKKSTLLSKLISIKSEHLKFPEQKNLKNLEQFYKQVISVDLAIEAHITRYQNHLLFPTPEIQQWINKSKNPQHLISMIKKNNGLIPKELFAEIAEPQYIERLLQEILIHFDQHLLSIIMTKTITEKITFKLTFLKSKTILEMPTSNFLEVFTELFFDESYSIKIIENRLKTRAEISQIYNKVSVIFEDYARLFKRLGFKLVVTRYTQDLLILQKNSTYFEYDSRIFLMAITNMHLGLEEATAEGVSHALSESFYRQFDEEEWHDYINLLKSLK